VVWGDRGIAYSAVAVVLCVVPAAATLLWAGWVSRHSPEQELLMVLGGTGVRMFVVLGVALALFLFVPFFGEPSFLLWIAAFYLLTLALEVTLVVRGRSSGGTGVKKNDGIGGGRGVSTTGISFAVWSV